MASFHFEFVSPDKLQFRGQVESVLVPGSEGDFVVLKDHAPVMASLRPGVVAIGEAAGKETRFFVRGGFADVNPAGLILLAETAIPAHDLTLNSSIRKSRTPRRISRMRPRMASGLRRTSWIGCAN